jgi:hypothetical protein
MKEIACSRGLVVKVDDEDFELVSQFKWLNFNGYAGRFKNKSEVESFNRHKRELVMMHRLLTDAPKGMDVDHINRDKTDNRRSNLRIVDRAANSRNQAARPKASAYKGVYPAQSGNGRWVAIMKNRGRQKWVGTFDTQEEAAMAWNSAVLAVEPDCPKGALNEVA